MCKRILKIICSLSFAFLLSFGSFYLPKLRTTASDSAFASYNPPAIQAPEYVIPPPGDNDNSYNYQSVFNGSDIVFSNVAYVKLSSISSGSTIQDFTLYNTNLNSNAFYDVNVNYLNFQFNLALTDNTFGILYKAFRSSGAYLYSPATSNGDTLGFGSIAFDYGFNDINSSFVPNSQYLYTTYSDMQTFKYYNFNRDYGYNFGFAIYRNNSNTDSFVSPTFDMRFLIIGNYLDVPETLGINLPYVNCNYVIYVDTAGYYYIIALPNGGTLASIDADSPYFYNYRRYILKDVDYTNNEYYQQGLQDGYSSGYDVGESDGYNDGYSSGLIVGKNLGYNEGLEANSRLTFTGLMTSVIDVPVKVFVNLFDFDILGVNILVFLSTLLTICLVLFLIKKIKGA